MEDFAFFGEGRPMVKYRPNAQGTLGLPGGSSYRSLHGLQWPKKNIMITSGSRCSKTSKNVYHYVPPFCAILKCFKLLKDQVPKQAQTCLSCSVGGWFAQQNMNYIYIYMR